MLVQSDGSNGALRPVVGDIVLVKIYNYIGHC